MLPKILTALSGNPNKRRIEQLSDLADQINTLEPDFEKLSDEALRAKTDEFRKRIADELPPPASPTSSENGESAGGEEKERREIEQDLLEELLPEAFAAVREASKRTLGLRHYDVQLMGGIALHRSTISEMRTGEGKTLVATLPIYLNALTGRGVHLITVNDYLARRDAKWMGPIYEALGMTVGVLQMAAVTENGKKAFLYDPEKESPREDQDKLRMVDRVLAYKADITYGTNAEFGFDYLRDNMVYTPDEKVQRGHYYAIVDEVDNVLIDEARTPLIISGPASGELETYREMSLIVRQLNEEDYETNEKDRSISLTEIGTAHVEQLLAQPLRDPDRPEDVTPEQARLLGFLEQALRAQYLFKRNKDYLVQSGKVVIVDEFTGRLMPGRRWSDGLHQAIEAKEGVKVEPENITYATITLQNYFRMYQKLAGMTGTALTESEEFHKIYKLEVLPIPTNLEYNATKNDSPLVEIKGKDQDGYAIAYFIHRPPSGSPRERGEDGGGKEPVFWRRTDLPDAVYRTAEAKLRSIATEIVRSHVLGRPVLVGSTSVENSERISSRLHAEPVRRLLQVQLLRHVWFEQNNKEQDGRLFAELEPLYKPLTELEPTFLRGFAKPLNVSINPEEPENLAKLLDILGLEADSEPRLKAVIQAGVQHEVLNARKHTEESQIIAGAGAFGAVTIATNMAGRGVDIKLGGELADEITATVSRVLRKAGFDPYNMRLEEQRQTLLKMDPADFGIYESEVNYFLKYFDDMESVRRLGGLHVIGSERHEARRIDNQLRGRSARQGDPGSSRFYLSLEDDLMRMFGGEQVDNIMQRFRLDDDFPLENRMVSNLIEGSQHRVEGANFDVRKHLLEYDDVLNQQRSTIYSQRDRVMVKDDLGEDMAELLRAEIAARVPVAMADEEGPWKLLAWLEQIQPSFAYGEHKIYPSFAYRVLLDELGKTGAPPKIALLDLVRQAVKAEEEHVMRAVEAALEHTAESLDKQIDERFDLLDTFLEGLRDSEEKKRPQEILDELNSTVHVQLRLNNEQMRQLADDPEALAEPIKDQIQTALSTTAVARLVLTIEYRLNEPLTVSKEAMARLEWDDAAEQIIVSARKMLENRLERLTGSNGGQVGRDIDALMAKMNVAGMEESDLIILLNSLARARRSGFDTRTHRQVQEEYMRFNYVYLAAHLLEGLDPQDVEADVLDHLEEARETLTEGWGEVEFLRLGQNAGRLSDIGPAAEVLGLEDMALVSLSEEQKATLAYELGRRRLTEVYRNVLLGAITELWVDYLTRVEALRISIGLEAYAQRDPLVQYKGKASEMFQALLAEIRSGAVSRMFLYLPRMTNVTETSAADAVVETPEKDDETNTARSGRKRHKRH
jgi:preprotein translocase subunit SecA